MDIVNIAGSALMMRAAQTQDAVSTSMLKAAAEQQNAMADLLAKNAQSAQPTPDPSYTFSTYA